MVPDVLMLIIMGILAGPVTGFLTVDDIGRAGSLFAQFALILILFEGGLGIDFRTLVSSARRSVALTVVFFVVSAITIALIMHYGFDYSPMASTVTGFICGGTSSAVVIPLLGMISVSDHTRTTLILESALTDVLCIVCTIGELQSFESGAFEIGKVLGTIVSSLVIASLIGVVFGLLWLRVLPFVRRFHNNQFATCFFMFVVFGIAEVMGFSGAISALTYGIVLGNNVAVSQSLSKLFNGRLVVGVVTDTEKALYRELAFMIKIFFFIYVGICIPFNNMGVLMVAVAIVVGLFALRPMATKAIIGKSETPHDQSVISVMIPKGLAAAVLAGMPSQYGMVEGGEIQAVTYNVVLCSIVMTSVLIPLVERTRYGAFLARFFKPLKKGSQSE